MKTSARIFLAQNRKGEQSNLFRTSVTEVGPVFIRDETLSPGYTTSYSPQTKGSTIVLPVVGSVRVKSDDQEFTVDAGDILQLTVRSNGEISFTNPFETELINFIHIRIEGVSLSSGKLSFDIETNLNKLNSFVDGPELKMSIGQFAGRSDQTISSGPNINTIAFVIEGAFEFQGRLLESRDALLLRGEDDIDFEALSNNAILLVIQTSMQV